jgi:hypothetical protein
MENDYEEFSTLNLTIATIKIGLDSLAKNIEEQAIDILGDLVEPLEIFTKVYKQETMECLE